MSAVRLHRQKHAVQRALAARCGPSPTPARGQHGVRLRAVRARRLAPTADSGGVADAARVPGRRPRRAEILWRRLLGGVLEDPFVVRHQPLQGRLVDWPESACQRIRRVALDPQHGHRDAVDGAFELPVQVEEQPQGLDEGRLLRLRRRAVVAQVLEGDLHEALCKGSVAEEGAPLRCAPRGLGAKEDWVLLLLLHLPCLPRLLDLVHDADKLLFRDPPITINVEHVEGALHGECCTRRGHELEDLVYLGGELVWRDGTVAVRVEVPEEVLRRDVLVLDGVPELPEEDERVGLRLGHLGEVLHEAVRRPVPPLLHLPDRRHRHLQQADLHQGVLLRCRLRRERLGEAMDVLMRGPVLETHEVEDDAQILGADRVRARRRQE
mmetsp:Transcript_14280/g.39155  ORF Transcript_14280/g.39155 Transcript_14280/m.39155 type:complete len:381 (-) Transcript_14280:143-1285(-)